MSSQFRGLSSTGKRKVILGALDVPIGATMEALLDSDGQPVTDRIATLRRAMLGEARAPKASELGIIGRRMICSLGSQLPTCGGWCASSGDERVPPSVVGPPAPAGRALRRRHPRASAGSRRDVT